MKKIGLINTVITFIGFLVSGIVFENVELTIVFVVIMIVNAFILLGYVLGQNTESQEGISEDES
jgi:hypothetical protein